MFNQLIETVLDVLDKSSNNYESAGKYFTPGKLHKLQKDWRMAKDCTKTSFNVLQLITKNTKTPSYILVKLQNFYHKHRLASKHVV